MPKGVHKGHKRLDLTGHEFGRLTVIGPDPERKYHWLARCECGVILRPSLGDLRRSKRPLRQCQPCAHAAQRKEHTRKHEPEYRTYYSMLQRCGNPKHESYRNYGGAGIAVWDGWKGPGGYDAFLAHIGRMPFKGATLDRIDNGKGYEPGNVRWATVRQQMRNRSNNILLTLNGKTQCLADWADELGLNRCTVRHRYCKGWPVERVLGPVAQGG